MKESKIGHGGADKLGRNEQGEELCADCGRPRWFQGCRNCFHNPFRGDDLMDVSPEVAAAIEKKRQEQGDE